MIINYLNIILKVIAIKIVYSVITIWRENQRIKISKITNFTKLLISVSLLGRKLPFFLSGTLIFFAAKIPLKLIGVREIHQHTRNGSNLDISWNRLIKSQQLRIEN